MSGSQHFAKLAILLLILINLGAYYAFWPANAPNPFTSAATPGRTSLKREDSEVIEPTRAAAPKPLAAEIKLTPTLPEAARLPESYAETITPAESPDPGVVPTVPGPLALKPEAPLAPEPLPARKVESPLPRAAFGEKNEDSQKNILESLKQAQADGPRSAVTSVPLPENQAVKLDNSPWSLQMEITQGRTLLRARLHKSAEFKIFCDRVEMKAPAGAVQALGKVTLTGPGVTASCQRLSLPLTGEQIVLEGQAEAKIHEAPHAADKESRNTPTGDNAPAWELRGESLTLRPSGTIRWQNTGDLKQTGSSDAIRPAAATSPEIRLPEVFRAVVPAVVPDFPRPK